MANQGKRMVKENLIAQIGQGGGGSTYTAGKGIEITDKNVINNIQDEVTANPELVGDETELTGLQVGNTKYKMPSSGSSQQVYTAIDICNILKGKTLNYQKFLAFLSDLGFSTNYTINQYTVFEGDKVLQIGQNIYLKSQDGSYIYPVNLLNMSISSSGNSIDYMVTGILNIGNSTGFMTASSLSQLPFDFDDGQSVAEGFYPGVGFENYISPIVSCIVEYVEYEDFDFETKTFEWEDFFACFDTAVNND